jgi:hypothetical protein
VNEVVSLWQVVEKLAGIPMAIVMSLTFVGLIIYLSIKLPSILSTQNILISNNTEATKSMSESVNMLGGVLQTITTNFAVHEECTKNIQSDVHDLQDDVSDIKQNGATKNELIAVHNRLDTVVSCVGIIQGKVN